MKNKYKWFVWSSYLRRYMALPHMFCDYRGEQPAIMVTPTDGGELPPMFSIPMYERHNAVARSGQA